MILQFIKSVYVLQFPLCQVLTPLPLSDVKAHQSIFLREELNKDLLKHEHHSIIKKNYVMCCLGLYPLIDKPTRITYISDTVTYNILLC